jgi:MinD-like ATPase involved in chromosome partitioning or flagellar assembly
MNDYCEVLMAADYDRLFQPPEGTDVPEEPLAHNGFDVNAPSPPSAPLPPAVRAEPPAPPKPNSQVTQPMPIDWQPQSPVQQHGRHARRGPREPDTAPNARPANPERGLRPNSHHVNAQRGATTAPADRPVPRRAAPATSPPPTKPAAKMVPQRGWRRGVYAVTRINLGLSRDEKYELELRTRIHRKIRGSYQVGVVGLKGGAGKTSVTAALGSAFAEVRGDRILAIDADQSSGNLADRVGRRTAATIADLLANDALGHYNDVRAHTSVNAVNLEVLSAAEYSAARLPISGEDWRRAVAIMPRYYNLALADCGVDLFDPATRGVLSTASGLVIVSSASVDGIRQAAVALEWLRRSEYHALLSHACVVINHVVPQDSGTAANDWAEKFERYVRPGRVIVLPWDTHIAAGTEIRLDLLAGAYKRRITELAAALSDDFDRGERR